MSGQPVLLDGRACVLVVAINRPDQRNAVNMEVAQRSASPMRWNCSTVIAMCWSAS